MAADDFTATPKAGAQEVDPMSFFPLPDPAAAEFTLEQLWPSQAGGKSALAEAPAWMRAMIEPPQG